MGSLSVDRENLNEKNMQSNNNQQQCYNYYIILS